MKKNPYAKILKEFKHKIFKSHKAYDRSKGKKELVEEIEESLR